MMRVLFVCMGNICRSPTVEGVARVVIQRAGLEDQFELDSAGTHDYHVGEAPDRRSQQAALTRGYDLSLLRARQVGKDDFTRFDKILAMDLRNLTALRELCPLHLHHKLELFLRYADGFDDEEVPDPYYGGATGFERVLDMAEAGVKGLIAAHGR